jgi:[protein-PII] uridylyltransferase
VLPEVATRRDLEDPSTAGLIARVAKDRQRLALLGALTAADGQATGTAAWGAWKAELVQRLVERAGAVLDGSAVEYAPPVPSESLIELMESGRLAIEVQGRRATVVAPDRPGLLAAVAGVLALNGCNVRRATATPGMGGMALEEFDIEPAFDRLPDWQKIERDIQSALDGGLPLTERLRAQEDAYARSRRAQSAYPSVRKVLLDNETSALATIIEVRAPDRIGLLHRVAAAVAKLDLDVVSAIVDTLGHEVIDTFYVRDMSHQKLAGADRLAEVTEAIQAVIGESAA